jgi:hypothetical protein
MLSILTILLVTGLVCSSHVQGQLVSSQDVSNFADMVHSGAVSFVDHIPEQGLVGNKCSNHESCQDGLDCVTMLLLLGGRCMPPIACFTKAALDFDSSFNWTEWADGLMDKAHLSREDLLEAAHNSTSLDDFQSQLAVVTFLNAFQIAPRPPVLQSLQDAADGCMPAAMARAPTTGGTISYMGLHIEVSALAKLAMSVYGSLGDSPVSSRYCVPIPS